jgi:nucleotide-binding universal stress UspA family protein
MALNTILVHLDGLDRSHGPLRYARILAQNHGAHLVGLTITPGFDELPQLDVGPATQMAKYRQSVRDETAAIKAAFDIDDPLKRYTSEWRAAEAGFRNPIHIVAEIGSSADLIVANQDDPNWENAGFGDRAGLLATMSARPVLLVPVGWKNDGVAQRVVIAWNGSRESTRAVFDAIPVLQKSQTVAVVAINETTLPEGSASAIGQGNDLRAALARHGINATFEIESASTGSVGQTLIATVERAGADLLVMGGYGRPRLSELIFGGATRHALRNMRTPVLMSH